MPKFMKSLNNISRSQTLYRRMRLDSELLPTYHTYVLAICRAPGRTQDELAADICVSKSTVARRIDWLLEGGYVSRVADAEDRRYLRVYPTEKMLAVLPEIRAIASEWNSMITDGIEADELAVFHAVLLKMEKLAKEATRQ